MTEVEWTKALDLLEGLDTEAQERLVKKLDEAKDWTSHRRQRPHPTSLTLTGSLVEGGACPCPQPRTHPGGR